MAKQKNKQANDNEAMDDLNKDLKAFEETLQDDIRVATVDYNRAVGKLEGLQKTLSNYYDIVMFLEPK